MKYLTAFGAGLALCVFSARRALRALTPDLRLDDIVPEAWLEELTERNDD